VVPTFPGIAMSQGEVELIHNDAANDKSGLVREMILGGMGDECFPMAQVSVLRGGGGLSPFGKELLVVINGDNAIDQVGPSSVRDVVKEGLHFGGLGVWEG
jgi:hypothetical protein